MIVVSGENTSSITITPVSGGANVTVANTTPTASVEVNAVSAASIPFAFEQRVTNLENNSVSTINIDW